MKKTGQLLETKKYHLIPTFVLEISIEKDDYYVGISGLDEDSFIDWGDGTFGVSESGSASHEYSSLGYLVEIIGTFLASI